MEVKAVQRYLITSPKKLREVALMIRGLTPQEAVEKLVFVKKRASGNLRKVIQSAIASAKQKGLEPQNLIFKEVQINEGPRLKRLRAGARGRIKPYKKRMSHIRVVLTTKKDEKEGGDEAVQKDNKNLRLPRQKLGKSKKFKEKNNLFR